MAAPVQVSTALPWYSYPFDNPQGQIEPFGGGPKPDSNVQVPQGYPISALLPGVITCINSHGGAVPPWGAAVTIKLDNPVNQLATHTAYLHLQPLPPTMFVGMRVQAGQVIGYSGGLKAQGEQKVPVGFALFSGDCYGYGSTWSQYLGSPQLNPYNLLQSAKAGNISSAVGGGQTSFNPLDPSTWLPAIFGDATLAWIQNPMRIIKMVVGLLLIGIALFLLVAPDIEKTVESVALMA